jgi:short-subunit dehydrogenase
LKVDSWDGRRVLVTGASSGIGAAMARDLASNGAVVGMCARRTALLDEVLADCRTHVPGCRAWTMDLSDIDALDGFVARVQSELGGIDTLVNNAGLVIGGDSAMDTPWPDVEAVVRTNYLSPVRVTLAALPAMRARGSGQIATISSMAARMSTPGESAYAGSKGALTAWFEALAGELWDSGVSVHLVYPALIEVTSDADGDDALADTPNAATHIPAPVCARAIRRQLERGDLELYVPTPVKDIVVNRAGNTQASIEMMAKWFAGGAPR